LVCLAWLPIIGAVFDFAGAVFIARGLIISKDEAIKLSVSRVSSDSEKKNLELPQVKDRLKQSRNAKIGVAFLTIGFLIQLMAYWLG
jgi:hypothetical protein